MVTQSPHHRTASSTRQRVFRYFWNNPAASNRQIADELHVSLSNVKVTLHRLRRMPDISRRCPECFAPSMRAEGCQSCGFEPTSASLPLDVRFDEQSPVNHIHAGNSLGSEVNYPGVGFTNSGLVVKRWMDRALEDSLTRDVKSEVMQALKTSYPTEAITDYAGRLCVKEVSEFRARYPLLAASKNVRKQLALNVMKRLEFLYPVLCRPHIEGVTRLQ
jgi:hypothetical protein